MTSQTIRRGGQESLHLLRSRRGGNRTLVMVAREGPVLAHGIKTLNDSVPKGKCIVPLAVTRPPSSMRFMGLSNASHQDNKRAPGICHWLDSLVFNN